jgi:hypothetical protein
MKLFIHHVGDNIWSVRENAAIALGNVAKNFGKIPLSAVVRICQLLPTFVTFYRRQCCGHGLCHAH